MKISLNGQMPTAEQLVALSDIVPTSFSLGEWSEYEENIEWEDMQIVYPNGDVLRCASYTGLWELLTLENKWDKCSDEMKLDILGDLYDHLGYFFTDQTVDIDEIELFQ